MYGPQTLTAKELLKHKTPQANKWTPTSPIARPWYEAVLDGGATGGGGELRQKLRRSGFIVSYPRHSRPATNSTRSARSLGERVTSRR